LGRHGRIVEACTDEADLDDLSVLLRTRGDRPADRRAAKQDNEIASSHKLPLQAEEPTLPHHILKFAAAEFVSFYVKIAAARPQSPARPSALAVFKSHRHFRSGA
jgi:hypothetical protein